MLNRLTISTLLKTAIALCGVAVITLLSFSVADSWSRLRTASRAAAATEASSDLFTALSNIRFDRANTYRALQADNPPPDTIPLMRKARAAELPALKSGMAILQQLDLPGQRDAVAELVRQVAKLEELHQTTDAAFNQAKPARPAGLADRGVQADGGSFGSDRWLVEGCGGRDQAAGFLYRSVARAEGSGLGRAQCRR